jgi:hypothetical protein
MSFVRLKAPILVLFFMGFFTSNSRGEQMPMSGRLIYSSGASNIMLLELESLKSQIIYDRSPAVSPIARLTKVSTDKFIFEECPVTGTCVLKEFDLNKRVARELCKGQMPTYLAQTNNLMFYAVAEGTNEKWLFLARLDAMEAPRKVAKAPPAIRLPNGLLSQRESPAVEISPDEVLFVGEDHSLWIYKISQSKLQPTGIAHSFPEVWRNRTQDLIIYDWEAKAHYRVNLDTKQTEKLPQYESAFGLFYIPELDTLIYGKARLYLFISERYDLFAYNFAEAKEIKLQSNVGISSGIWLP